MPTPKTKTPKTKKLDHKQVSEVLLPDRLGLNEEWIERWEENGEWKVECSAPDQLPEFIRKGRKKPEIEEIEDDIERLVAAGCNRRVIYFCLQQLSPAAIWLRAGGDRKSVEDKRAGLTDDLREDNTLLARQEKLATREDLEAVVAKAWATRELILKHQRELLLTADAAEISLPRCLTARLELAEDALELLANSLTWVAKLAEAYTAPMETILMKSKGLLYLALYVSVYADPKKLRSAKVSQVLKDSSRASGDVRAKRVSAPGNALADVATRCAGEPWSISDLREKLKGFEAEHPQLYDKLRSKLIELHRFAPSN